MASKYLQKFPIPKDFSKILHDFTKEILQDQPKDIIDYAYHYFKALEAVITYTERTIRLPKQRNQYSTSQKL